MSPGCPKSKLPETNFDFYRDSTWENPTLGKRNPRKSSALRSSQPSGGSGDHGRGLPLSNLRVLVCGGRDYANADALHVALDGLHSERQFGLVITGGARGADTMAHNWALSRGIPTPPWDFPHIFHVAVECADSDRSPAR